MNYLKQYKIFESEEYESEEADTEKMESLFFSEKSVEDLFMNLIDHQFDVSTKRILVDKDFEPFHELTDHVSSITGFVEGKIFGCYEIEITLPTETDIQKNELAKWSLLFSELKRITNKFKDFKCDIHNYPSFLQNHPDKKIRVRILAEHLRDTEKFHKILDNTLELKLKTNKDSYISNIIKAFRLSMFQSMSLVRWPSILGNKIYFIYKPVKKNIATLAVKKAEDLVARSTDLKSVKLVDSAATLAGPLKHLKFTSDVLIIELELDLKYIEKKILNYTDIKFLKKMKKRKL